MVSEDLMDVGSCHTAQPAAGMSVTATERMDMDTPVDVYTVQDPQMDVQKQPVSYTIIDPLGPWGC